MGGRRAEFEELQQQSRFGQREAEEDSKHLDLSMAGRELTAHAPLFAIPTEESTYKKLACPEAPT